MRRSGGARPTRRPHRPVEEGVGLRARRPDALVETAEHDPVDGQETCLEEAEDLDAAVRRARRRAGDPLLGERREEGRVVDEAAAHAPRLRQGEVVEQAGEMCDGDVAVGAILVAVRRLEQTVQRAPMGIRDGDEVRRVFGLRREPVERGRQAIDEIDSEAPVILGQALPRTRRVPANGAALAREGLP